MLYLSGTYKEEVRIPSQGKSPASAVTLSLRSTVGNTVTGLSVESCEVQGDYLRLILRGAAPLPKGEYSYLLSFSDEGGEVQTFSGLAVKTGEAAVAVEEVETETTYLQYE